MTPSYFHARKTVREDELEGVPLAGFGQRALGFLIDLVIVIMLWAPLELLWARFVSHEWDGHSHFNITFTFHEWRSLLMAMLYYVIINYFSGGRSIGKWAAGTRIVSLHHSRLSLWQCVERVFGYGVSTAEGIGFVQFFFSPNRMCVHDRIAETIVIDARKKATRLAPATADTASGRSGATSIP